MDTSRLDHCFETKVFRFGAASLRNQPPRDPQMTIRPSDWLRRAPLFARQGDPKPSWDDALKKALEDRSRKDGKPAELRPDEVAHPIQQDETVYRVSNGDLVDAESRNPQIADLGEVDIGDIVFVKTDTPAQPPKDTPPPAYAPNYDPEKEPELALRAELGARYLGGTANGKDQKSPEELYGVPTDKLAETMADGNPLEQAAYVSMYGGNDPVTGKTRKPLWEEMGVSREQLRQTMTERPWEVTSFHLGRKISQEDYAKLQKTDGPLGHLLNLGVDPKTALSIQATWSAHFHGGYDPITQAKLKPVWERWALGSPDQLQQMFADSPAAVVMLADLAGGKNPTNGQPVKAPWGDKSAEIYGAEQLKSAQGILGIEVLPETKKVMSPEDAEAAALGFTTVSGEKQIDYSNPVRFAQSPTFRNGLQLAKGNIIGSGLMDPLGNMGLFGLVKGDPRAVLNTATGKLKAFGRDDQKVQPGQNAPDKSFDSRVKWQVHGLFQVDPRNDSMVFLTKVQRLPKLTEQEKKDNKPPPKSTFIKGMGNWSPAGGGVNIFAGKADESDGSRGRQPAIIGVNWANAPDGTIERFGAALGGPFGALGTPLPGSGQPYHAYGLQFQMGKTQDGNWVPSGIGAISEWGTNRYQFWPMVNWDPDGGGPTGGTVWGGTGWTLAQVGMQYDPSRPTTRLNLMGGGTDGMTPSVSYSDPSVFGFDLGGMYGKDGRAVGLGISSGKSSNVEVVVDVENGDTDGAERKAKDYHRQLAEGKITALDLPKGVRVSSSAEDSASFRAMGFYAYVNVGGGFGNGMNVTTNVSRGAENTWTVARYDEPKKDYFWNVGVFGIGPGNHHWDAALRGESLTVTAPPGPDGKPALDPKTREALDRYLKEGLLPAAVAMDSRFQGKEGENYKSVRDAFLGSEKALQDAKAVPPSSDKEKEEKRTNAVVAAEKTYANKRSDLNGFLRQNLKPGDEIMPGVKLTSTSKRDTEGNRPTFVIPLGSTTITRGETKTEKNTYHTYELKRRPLLGWDYDNQHAQRTGEGNDIYELSSTGTVAYNEGHISHYLPFPVIKDIEHKSVYQPLWDAAEKKKSEMRGTLSIQFTDAQIVALGQSMSDGTGGKPLWESFANRTSGAFDDQFLQKNKEYRDNHPNLLEYSREAKKLADKYDLKDKGKLAETFSRVTSPEAFAKLSDKEQDLFVDLVGLTASADHSAYETLAPIAAVSSEDRRSAMLKRVVENIAERKQPLFADVNTGPGRDDVYKDRGTLDRGMDRVTYFDDPTVEFARFLKEDLYNSKDLSVRDTLLQQSGFQSALPDEIESRRTKSLDALTKEVKDKYTEEMTIYFPGGPKPTKYLALTHDEARDMVGILAAVGQQTGGDGIWTFMKDQKVDPAQIFARLRTNDGHDQVLRQAFVDVLRPGVLGQDAQSLKLLDEEEKRAK